MGSPFKMKPGSKPGSNRDRGMMQMSERGLVNDEGPKSHGKPHYDTTEAGRPTQYGVMEAIPGSIKQRKGPTDVQDDMMSTRSQSTLDARSGMSFDGQALSHVNDLYTNKNSVAGEFKRRTADKNMQKPNKPGLSNVHIESSASMKDPRSGKNLIDTGALGSKRQMDNYGYATKPEVSMTNSAASRSAGYIGRQAQKDSKVVDKKVLKAAKKYVAGEKAISMGSNKRTEVKGPSLNSQLLGGMQQGDPKPKVKKSKGKGSVTTYRTKAGKILGDVFGPNKNASGQRIHRSASNAKTF